ncbi:LiaI-LiaF-like domain-containing protein [Pedobacter sp. SYSU D00535]|uniref:LiaF transmembrane domain-containing protein n=1 Tax=Pedobacter sp. SYSU D00535 TaxID=2810308 RepID=UPI001A972ED4|nr:DUF5668 domain-containing protein [Pedobacter sp. SYSU D00535]
MRTERIIWGLIFVFIGGVLLLDNFEVIDFHWEIIWRFWPLVLIVIGANMLFSRDSSDRSGAVAVVITIAALAFIAYEGSRAVPYQDERWFDRDEEEENISTRPGRSSSNFSEQLTAGVRYAELNISGGATKYVLQDSTIQLFEAEVKKNFGNYSLFKISKDSVDVLNFKMKGKQNWNMDNVRTNEAFIKLNPSLIWDINLEMGAGKLDFDLSKFNVRNLKFEGGAASVNLKLGQPEAITTVSAETGVSGIEIAVPEAAACQIRLDSGLSSSDFEGFTKLEDGSYETPNFKTATKKIIIDLEGGLSKFEVKRY